MTAIEARQVYKSYGDVEALRNFSITVPENSVFALLGPNGAGKTTFVKTLLGLCNFDDGSIKIFDKESRDSSSRMTVGYLPERFNFFPYYTVEGVMNFFGKMHDLSSEERIHANQIALEKVGIAELKKRKIRTLSKGQTQRVGIAALLIGKKNLLILDEPFSGLDPIGIKELKELIKELKNDGKTIFINSHILSEMEIICDEAAIINNGALLTQGKLPDMLGSEKLEDFFYKLVRQA